MSLAVKTFQSLGLCPEIWCRLIQIRYMYQCHTRTVAGSLRANLTPENIGHIRRPASMIWAQCDIRAIFEAIEATKKMWLSWRSSVEVPDRPEWE